MRARNTSKHDMGLDRSNLPDAFLRRVSPADRARLRLPINTAMDTSMNVSITVHKAAPPKQPAKPKAGRCSHAWDYDYHQRGLKIDERRKCLKCGEQQKAVFGGWDIISQAKPKAHGAGYRVAVVLAYFKECGLPAPTPEYRFCERKWRFDFAWPYIGGPTETKVALEVQGGIFARLPGGHNRGAQIRREHEKRNLAACLGWRILYCETETLCTQATVDLIRRALDWKP
jgi:hypothetical protein